MALLVRPDIRRLLQNRNLAIVPTLDTLKAMTVVVGENSRRFPLSPKRYTDSFPDEYYEYHVVPLNGAPLFVQYSTDPSGRASIQRYDYPYKTLPRLRLPIHPYHATYHCICPLLLHSRMVSRMFTWGKQAVDAMMILGINWSTPAINFHLPTVPGYHIEGEESIFDENTSSLLYSYGDSDSSLDEEPDPQVQQEWPALPRTTYSYLTAEKEQWVIDWILKVEL
ncbi:hypothetical protein VNI00_004761 [Paramarasmius palmivorus]|uniref:Uncharacterized protein n=1 Tax=Paramarasmius palmivorus TaxID=297713 RepID=A0AAW0DEW0_9AGAR